VCCSTAKFKRGPKSQWGPSSRCHSPGAAVTSWPAPILGGSNCWCLGKTPSRRDGFLDNFGICQSQLGVMVVITRCHDRSTHQPRFERSETCPHSAWQPFRNPAFLKLSNIPNPIYLDLQLKSKHLAAAAASTRVSSTPSAGAQQQRIPDPTAARLVGSQPSRAEHAFQNA